MSVWANVSQAQREWIAIQGIEFMRGERSATGPGPNGRMQTRTVESMIKKGVLILDEFSWTVKLAPEYQQKPKKVEFVSSLVPDSFFGTSELVEKRRASAIEKGAQETCQPCGRKIDVKTGFAVEVVNGGSLFSVVGSGDETDNGYMGIWYVGSECIKKVPPAYRKKISDLA